MLKKVSVQDPFLYTYFLQNRRKEVQKDLEKEGRKGKATSKEVQKEVSVEGRKWKE